MQLLGDICGAFRIRNCDPDEAAKIFKAWGELAAVLDIETEWLVDADTIFPAGNGWVIVDDLDEDQTEALRRLFVNVWDA